MIRTLCMVALVALAGCSGDLRDDPATEAVPVIMLTSGSADDPDHIAREPRPDAFVRKSADVAPLLAEIRDALRRTR